jgi:O-acetyl-ADP-ribose deacetylase (regulator of RNase III)
MKIEVVKADITRLDVEAIVNPANSRITMGGGLAGIIRSRGGEEIREEAQRHVPVPVGKAVVTGAGRLPCKYVIHAPTMERPAMKITAKNTELAMKAVLECAEENGISEVAVPGLGTGVGGVPLDDAARVMIGTAKGFRPGAVRKVIFVSYDDEFYEALRSHA